MTTTDWPYDADRDDPLIDFSRPGWYARFRHVLARRIAETGEDIPTARAHIIAAERAAKAKQPNGETP